MNLQQGLSSRLNRSLEQSRSRRVTIDLEAEEPVPIERLRTCNYGSQIENQNPSDLSQSAHEKENISLSDERKERFVAAVRQIANGQTERHNQMLMEECEVGNSRSFEVCLEDDVSPRRYEQAVSESNHISNYIKVRQDKFNTESINKRIQNIQASISKNRSVLTNYRLNLLRNFGNSNQRERSGGQTAGKQVLAGCDLKVEEKEQKGLVKNNSKKALGSQNPFGKREIITGHRHSEMISPGCWQSGKFKMLEKTSGNLQNPMNNDAGCGGFRDGIQANKIRAFGSITALQKQSSNAQVPTLPTELEGDVTNLPGEAFGELLEEKPTNITSETSFRQIGLSEERNRLQTAFPPKFVKKKSSSNCFVACFNKNEEDSETNRKQSYLRQNGSNFALTSEKQRNLVSETTNKVNDLLRKNSAKSRCLRIEIDQPAKELHRLTGKMLTPQSRKNVKNNLFRQSGNYDNQIKNSRKADSQKLIHGIDSLRPQKPFRQLSESEAVDSAFKGKVSSTKAKNGIGSAYRTPFEMKTAQRGALLTVADMKNKVSRKLTVPTPKLSFTNFMSAKNSPNRLSEKHFVFKNISILGANDSFVSRKEKCENGVHATQKFQVQENNVILEEPGTAGQPYSSESLEHANFKMKARVSSFAKQPTEEVNVIEISNDIHDVYLSGVEGLRPRQSETAGHARRHSVQVAEMFSSAAFDITGARRLLQIEADDSLNQRTFESNLTANPEKQKLKQSGKPFSKTGIVRDSMRRAVPQPKNAETTIKPSSLKQGTEETECGVYKETQFNHVFKIMNLLENDEKLNDRRRVIREKMRNVRNKVSAVENMQRGQGTLKNDEDEFLKDYTIKEVIGEGSYALVKLATKCSEPCNPLAVKIYKTRTLEDPLKQQNLENEVRVLQQTDHPAIIKFHQSIRAAKHHFIIMDFFSKTSLQEFLDLKQAPISEEIMRPIVYQIASALEYLHSRGIIHRDIKLQNVLIRDDLMLKLIDFGFAVMVDNDAKLSVFCGTPSYMAPEIVKRTPYDGRKTDVWALGVLMYKLLTGAFPFRATTENELYAKIKAVRVSYSESVSNELRDLFGKIFVAKPEDRLTASALLGHKWFNFEASKATLTTACSPC